MAPNDPTLARILHKPAEIEVGAADLGGIIAGQYRGGRDLHLGASWLLDFPAR